MVTIESLSYHDAPRHNYDYVTMFGIISRWMTVGTENDHGFGWAGGNCLDVGKRPGMLGASVQPYPDTPRFVSRWSGAGRNTLCDASISNVAVRRGSKQWMCDPSPMQLLPQYVEHCYIFERKNHCISYVLVGEQSGTGFGIVICNYSKSSKRWSDVVKTFKKMASLDVPSIIIQKKIAFKLKVVAQ